MNIHIGTIPESYRVLLHKIREQEGGRLHYNRTESDITTGYGIYKAKHPRALIFKYIEEIAEQNRITTDTTKWNSSIILDKINELIVPSMEVWLSYLFYKEFYKQLHLDQLHPILVDPFVSIYTNGVRLFVISLQRAINKIYQNYNIDPTFSVTSVDGYMGPVTLKWYINISKQNEVIIKEFKNLFLLYAKSYYINLACKKPNKYLVYLKGWDNRVNGLL